MEAERGTDGITVTRTLKEITFPDGYQAARPIEEGTLFHFHSSPGPDCPVERNIHDLLRSPLQEIQNTMEKKMSRSAPQDMHAGIEKLLKEENT